MAYSTLSGKCPCGNDDPLKIRHYIFPDDNQFLGILCLNCNQEWLTADSDTEVDEENTWMLGQYMLRKHHSKPIKVQPDLAPRSRTEIRDLSLLKRGDHFAFKRPYKVNAENSRFEAIHLSKAENGKFQVNKKRKPVSRKDRLYRVDDEENHDICEDSVDYRTGVSKRCQMSYMLNLVGKKVAGMTGAEAGAAPGVKNIFSAETGEQFLKGSRAVGAGLIVAAEGIHMSSDLFKLNSQRQNGDASYKEYIHSTAIRVSEGVSTVGLSAAAAFGGDAIASAVFGSAFATAFIGFYGATLVPFIIAKPLGHYIGDNIGKFITEGIKYDNRMVEFNPLSLQPGDQIVMPRDFWHMACHALFVSYEDDESKIRVIRRHNIEGIVEVVIDLPRKLSKIVYDGNVCVEPEKAISRARSKVGKSEFKFSFLICQSFVEWCKLS
ncbi:uncharacterized protein LOC130647755 [Hydractinia symbiolongicarpus]|uniref:uncharacterized protein LOC130647755 n=1 Tax=Hydractinia symbiolongicarpus TaxID=13093 RepID=UPI00254D0C56|nr:uncharacterized protein LOC130647755 [Hydractinia symbiolongicarpus]